VWRQLAVATKYIRFRRHADTVKKMGAAKKAKMAKTAETAKKKG